MDMNTVEFIAQKYNLNLRTKSMPIVIEGMSRGTLAYLFAELDFKVGVEIGVQGGRFARKLGSANPNAIIYGIDPWLSYDDYGWDEPQEAEDRGYEIAKATVPENYRLVRKMSMEAIKDFEDNSIDFVYIDGNHQFPYVAEDIFYWSKKVRPNGIISGHDYRRYYPSSHIHVFEVVNAYTAALKIRPWFITDNATENVMSWFWVKQ